MIKAYLFPENEASVSLKMSEAELPEGFIWKSETGKNGIILSVGYEDEEAAKEILKKIFGSALYSFQYESAAQALVERLSEENKRIAVAESCTGGLFAERITDVAGASKVFGLGLTVYSNEAKEELLGVSKHILDEHSAVSREVANALAANVRRRAGSAVGVGITGYAGPEGGEDGTPVGTVYIGVSTEKECIISGLKLGENKTRDQIRDESVRYAMALVNRALDNLESGEGKAEKPKKVKEETGEKKSIFERVNGFFISAYKYLIPQKADLLKEKIRKIAFLVAIAVFIGSISYIGNYYLSRLSNDLELDKLQSEYYKAPTQDEIDNLPEGYLEKFARLYSINPDIAGWLKVGDTIDFPVVQTNDNDFYLKRDFYKKDNFHGVPYLDYRCSTKLLTTNSIIYGHNVKPNRMFAELVNYKRLDYYRNHPTFTYDTVYEEHTFKVLYVMILDSESSHGGYFGYQNFVSATSDADWGRFINNCKQRTIIDTTVDVNPTDTLLTLSTCGFDFSGERIVIVARMVRDGESEVVDTAHASANADVLMPDIWYSIWGTQKPSVNSGSSSSGNVSSDKPSGSSSDTSSESTPEESSSSKPTESSSSTPGESSSSTPEESSSSTPEEPSSSNPSESSSTPEESSSTPEEPSSSTPEGE